MNNALQGKYEIVREIARSNDIVYEAKDTKLGRRIALKELNLTTGLTGQAKRERIERFSREARAAGRLSHPNIVSIFEYGEEDGRYFIAMEYLEGQNLRDKIQVQGALPLKEALDIAYQMLDALAYAHQNRVIHRDIKPDNIHILPGGQVKITDFGIARLTEEPSLTSNGQVFGTPSYMSPEQIEGKSIDYRSDLFSMGIVLYEMLVGRKPFTGDSVITITYNIMNNAPGAMSGVPAAIERVVSSALSKSPLQRPSTAEQMKSALQQAEMQPATFLPHSPGSQDMSRMATGAYAAPSGYPGAAPMPSAAPPHYGTMPPNYAPVPPNPPQQSQLPWQWNGMPQNSAQAQMQAAVSLPQMPGQPPNVPLHFPTPKAEPFVLPPGVKTTLLVLAAAVIVGGGLALGAVAMVHRYDRYRVEASTLRVAALMAEGEKAYNAQDYDTAAKKYAAALRFKPDETQRLQTTQNLAASYIQLGQKEAGQQHWEKAKSWYDKALTLPDNEMSDLARSERANAEEHLGNAAAAAHDRSTVSSNGGAPAGVPDKAMHYTPEDNKPVSPEDMNRPREQARQLLREGDELERKGDHDGAMKKWNDAVAAAPGTPEATAAMQRIENAAASSGSNPSGP